MAKLIINIDDDKYESIKNHYYFMYETGVMFAIKNGVLLPTNATNGDVIKALFPNVAICEVNPVEMDAHIGNGVHFVTQFDKEWWNAPYEVTK